MSEALNHLAGRVAGDPSFLAHAIAEYARSESLDDARLAAALGCAAGDLARLRLCRAPRAAPDEFRTDVALVAARFGIDPTLLTRILRLGLSLAKLRAARPAAADAGFLLAARDDDRDPPPAGEPPP